MTMAESGPLFQFYVCTHCKEEVLPDDAESPTDTGMCLCRRCVARMEDDPRHSMRHSVYLDVNEAMGNGESNTTTPTPEGSDYWLYGYDRPQPPEEGLTS